MAKNAKKMVYFFGNKKAEGNGKMKDLLGGKGANLAEMVNNGMPVPPGFTISTKVCNYFSDNKGKMPTGFEKEYLNAISKVEREVGKKFGNEKDPLLVSVRSGAKFSMPGMMDTVLNLGLNETTVEALAEKSGNRRFSLDSYRRFIQMFSGVVLEIDKELFDEILDHIKEEVGVELDTELRENDLELMIKKFKALVKKQIGKDFPDDPMTQLALSRDAVFKSWNNPRAFTYRRMNKIADDLGTAVNVQAMVFGNMGNDSATGVGFTRNPSTGKKEFYGEYLTNAQGEDVVAGIRTPKPIIELKDEMPKVFSELKSITDDLEKHYSDIQDFEFTVEKGKLYMLQTRTGKRTAHAAIKIAVDMVREKMISKEEAILRIEPESLEQLLHPIFDEKVSYDAATKGLPASPGAAVGKVVFSSEDAVIKSEKDKVILVRTETCPDDIHGMEVATGILTARGGMTSHAAVVARGMGKCCVAGCEDAKVDEKGKKLTIGKKIIKDGDYISMNGSTGEVIFGQVSTIEPALSGDFAKLMGWVNKVKKLDVRANADIPRDAKVAREFGAQGIGLCRTEHMFFDSERLPLMQKMILADTEKDRKKALARLLPFQKEDFKGLYKEMKGFAVTVRLLDPPLHEFLPKTKKEAKELSRKIGIDEKTIWQKTEDLHEFNPMLGHRGCRLGITYPEITEMQTRAIISAACELAKKNIKVVPEIMVPLVGGVAEFADQKAIIDATAKETMGLYKTKVKYLVGTMIEVPRAALTANKIAEVAEFFSFGTNDLTQMTMGFSRDDAGKFIKAYVDKKIFVADPFQTLDQEGVGQLVEVGINKGRSTKRDLKIGICGEHSGDPDSIKFFHKAKMDYVSCSPYRVPIASLASAQAVIIEKETK